MRKVNILGVIGTFLDTLAKISIVALVVMYTNRFAGEAYEFGYKIFTEEPVSTAPGLDITVTIPKGSNAYDIGKLLEERGVIRDARVFFVQELISDYRGKLSAGTYTLNTSWDIEDLLAVLASETRPSEEQASVD